MRKIKNNWKVALIVAVGIIAIILLGVFCIQSSQGLSNWRIWERVEQ